MKKVRQSPRIGDLAHSQDSYLGAKIRDLRQDRGLSQKTLAEMAKVAQATVAHIETGRKDPSVDTLRKIAKALDVHIATFFVESDLHVFDLPRLRRKYSSVDKLTPALYMALGKVVQYARDIGFIK